MFEAWSLHNVFLIPPELKKGGVVVLPHDEGGDHTECTSTGTSKIEEKERDLVEQMDELRKRLDEVRFCEDLAPRYISNPLAVFYSNGVSPECSHTP